MTGTQINRDAATGDIIPSRYTDIEGIRRVSDLPTTTQLIVFTSGGVGSGKSTLAGGCPRAAILDMEHKYSNVRSLGRGSEPLSGKSPEAYMQLLELLIEDGRNGSAHFSTVIIDPLNTFVAMVRKFLTADARSKNWMKDNQFGDITKAGMEGSGWDVVNQMVNGFLIDLAHAGYGMFITAHMHPKILSMSRKGRESNETIWESAITPKILQQVVQLAHYKFVIVKETSDEKEATGRTFKTQGGVVPETRTVQKTRYFLSDEEMPGSLIPRGCHIPLIGMPLELPAIGGYDAWADVYNRSRDEFRQAGAARGGAAKPKPIRKVVMKGAV